MGSYKFAVGQAVLVAAHGQFSDIKKGERFHIARLLPLEGQSPLYRIKSDLDGHERIARESQLQLLFNF
jgi:hypothetical protein